MRILIVTPFYKPAFAYGGPTRSVPSLAEAIAQQGQEVSVFTTDANGSRSLDVVSGEPFDLSGVQVRYFKRNVAGGYFLSTGLARACLEQASKYDIVYVVSNWGFPFLPACLAARLSGVPYVVSPRTAFMRRTWDHKMAKKWAYHLLAERALINAASALHYTTSLEQAESAWVRLRPEAWIVSNPVALSEFERLPDGRGFRAKWGIPDSHYLVLYLGRVEPRKGLEVTVNAFARMLQGLPETTLVIAGPEEDRHSRELIDLASHLGIRANVVVTGFLDSSERLEALGAADAFVLTSHSENFGVAVVEAMASGLPVILSDKVGLAEIVRREGAGLVTPLDPVAVADALLEVLHHPEVANQMGIAGRRAAQREFAPQQIARDMLARFATCTTVRGRG